MFTFEVRIVRVMWSKSSGTTEPAEEAGSMISPTSKDNFGPKNIKILSIDFERRQIVVRELKYLPQAFTQILALRK
jgi:hypothetical protein